MKAVNLKQALQYFDPVPLSEQNLGFWFVPRQGSPRRRLRIVLETSPQPVKVLFVGHRGSGKSTELNKLAEELSGTFQTIGFNVLEITGRTTPEYEDVMLALSTQVTLDCIQRGWLSQPLAAPVRAGWERLHDWWQQVVAGTNFQPAQRDATISVKLQTLVGQIELGTRQSSTTRETIKFQINQQMPELIKNLNWVIEQSETNSGKRLLLVVEGLDKVDLKSAQDIFRDHAPTITAPNASMIYTFPLALRHSDDYNSIRLSFPQPHFLPNVSTRHADGTPDADGIKFLRDLVLARVEERLIEVEALNLVVQANGGIPVWLVVLLRSAAVYALERSELAESITVADVQNAIRDWRREGIAPLSRGDIEVLRARHRDRQLSNDPEEQRLLFNGSLIEYSNEESWCDAHPALWSRLQGEQSGSDA